MKSNKTAQHVHGPGWFDWEVRRVHSHRADQAPATFPWLLSNTRVLSKARDDHSTWIAVWLPMDLSVPKNCRNLWIAAWNP